MADPFLAEVRRVRELRARLRVMPPDVRAKLIAKLGDDDAVDDGEIRLASKDRLFTLQERGAEPPELTVHNRDVSTWLSPVFLALATKISSDEIAGHA
jgi:hypothetical protein